MSMWLPPYDFRGSGGNSILLVENNEGIIVRNLRAFPLYQTPWFSGWLEDGLDIGSQTIVYCIGHNMLNDELEALTDAYMTLTELVTSLSSDFGGREIDASAEKPWEGNEDIVAALTKNASALFELFMAVANSISVPFFTVYDNAVSFLANGLKIPLATGKREAFLIDLDFGHVYPDSVPFSGDTDIGYTMHMPKQPMIKLGHKLKQIMREDGSIIAPDTDFELTKDTTELITAEFEPLTDKAHGGVLMKFDK